MTQARWTVRKITSLIVMLSLVGCASPQPKSDTYDLINSELKKAIDAKGKTEPPANVADALLPPIKIEVPKARPPAEERFSVTFNNVPAPQFFMSIVSGTRYSMLVHPDVTGTISVNLKDVTVFEALDAVRELYGYDYTVDGTRIYVKPLSLQTRVFLVNYLTGVRKGTSAIRVTSGSVSDSSYNGSTGNGNPANPGSTPSQGNITRSLDSSKITTSSDADFWSELKTSLQAIVGNKEGRSVVVSPQSGIVVVRAMWDEMRNVQHFLKAAQLSVDREVILEAKILEVQLNDGYQSGVNWAAFHLGENSGFSGGIISPGTTLHTFPSSLSGNGSAVGSSPLTSTPGSSITSSGGPLFGLAFQTSNFASLLSFLETQGTVHVLSSPRIATLNNQKAVLKVGTDEFFVTNVSTTTGVTGVNGTTAPTASVTVQPFFSGVALDVTPQIDKEGNVILHVHPSVSNVTQQTKQIDLGSAVGTFNLPLASSSISETDSVVRGRDGQIFAIGGLMRQASTYDRSQVPGSGDMPILSTLLGNTNQLTQKRELVILLKPTVVQAGQSWTQDMLESQQRIEDLNPNRLHEQ